MEHNTDVTSLISLPVFDSLTHVTCNGKWFNTSCDASIDRLIHSLDNQTKKALLVALPGDDHLYLKKCCEEYKEKLIGIGAIEPLDIISEESIEEKINTHFHNGFKGIKIHPRLLKINLAHPIISKIIQIAGRYNLISMLCTVHVPPANPVFRPIYDIIHQICDENQNNKIIFLHGGYYELLPTSEILRQYKNILLDLSATLIRYHETSLFYDFCFLFKTMDRKICIGSDFPEATISDVMDIFYKKIIPYSDIPRNKLYKIFYGNLAQLFSLEVDDEYYR